MALLPNSFQPHKNKIGIHLRKYYNTLSFGIQSEYRVGNDPLRYRKLFQKESFYIPKKDESYAGYIERERFWRFVVYGTE